MFTTPKLTISDLELGHNVMWKERIDPFDSSSTKSKVAIVFLIEDDQAIAAPVEPADANAKGHDEGGADERRDEHHVSLKGYGSIYENILDRTDYEYYATAEPQELVYINDSFLDEHHVSLIPDTDPMPYEIVIELQNHIWRDELEEQIPMAFDQFDSHWNQTQQTQLSDPAPHDAAVSQPVSRPVPPVPSAKDSPDESGPEAR